MFRYIILFLFLAVNGKLFAATATISDSIDISHITVRLNITDYAGHIIKGNAEIHLKAKVDNINSIPLDLLSLTVDSVKNEANEIITFTHVSELLKINLPDILNTDDSTTLTVFYHGAPAQDGTWGGWYWSGDYSYQLGVGFDAIPHNYGRVWFPCFDNFIERQTFRTEITTTNDKKAFCGGLMEAPIDNGDGTTTWIWNLNREIPSYLASVSVSKYTTVNMTYTGIAATIPIQIAAKPEDTIDLKNSFIHLNDALSIFENHYGAYQWDRVGYSVVPFSGGAMEHAMNIAYPLFAITGTTVWENLYVHELSHHWWGDLITTSSAEEMWMNEGWAVYSEKLFTEFFYGEQAYKDVIKANHLDVLHNAAFDDGQNYFAISGVPQEYTYGSTTYRKGADVIHTLRGYMGDDNFFNCIKGFLDTHKFQEVSAADLRDYLTECSGMDMNDFFDGWVYQSGSPAFEIQDFGFEEGGGIKSICIEQKLHHAPAYCNNVPLTISFFDYGGHKIYEKEIIMSGEHMSFDLSDAPEILTPNAIIDYDEKINDAITEDEITVHTTGEYNLPNALMDITVNSITDSAYLYVQHFWVAADGFKIPVPGLHVNNQRYWKVSGNFPVDFQASAQLLYNGQTVSGGFLDNEFITNSDDSLVLLFRNSQEDDWKIYDHYTLNVWGVSTDKRGAFELSELQPGEYAIGIYDHSLPTAPAETFFNCPDDVAINDLLFENSIHIYPNPSTNQITVETGKLGHLNLRLINSQGDTVLILKDVSEFITIPVKNLPAGTYQLYVENSDLEKIATKNVMVIH